MTTQTENRRPPQTRSSLGMHREVPVLLRGYKTPSWAVAGVAHRHPSSPAWTPCKYQHLAPNHGHGFTFVQRIFTSKVGVLRTGVVAQILSCGSMEWYEIFSLGALFTASREDLVRAGPTLSSQSQGR